MSSAIFVSVLIPCRNEARFIGACLESVVRNTYPRASFEILVVDGMSTDGTRDIIVDLCRQYDCVRLVDNPRRITPAALNVGITAAKGDILIRLDAHATYDSEYLEKCVTTLQQSGADNVGGIWKVLPRSDGLLARGIAASLAHPFGIGNAHYRYAAGSEWQWVDTVPFFCCRREVFDRIGLFNESLPRGQDMEFSMRLAGAGGRTLLNPGIVSHYYARTEPRVFVRHNWTNGEWAIRPFAYSDVVPVAWRHLVPLAFVGGIVMSALIGLFSVPVRRLGQISLASYVLASVSASLSVARQQRDVRFVAVMPLVFAMLHVPYGAGSLWGLVELALERGKRRLP
jgi:glycosyltransferase involved in cell wall biosynthesis